MKSDNYNKIAHDHGYKKMNSYELLDAYLDKHLDQQMLDIAEDGEKIDDIENFSGLYYEFILINDIVGE